MPIFFSIIFINPNQHGLSNSPYDMGGGGFRPPLISLNLGITAPPKFHKIIFCM